MPGISTLWLREEINYCVSALISLAQNVVGQLEIRECYPLVWYAMGRPFLSVSAKLLNLSKVLSESLVDLSYNTF